MKKFKKKKDSAFSAGSNLNEGCENSSVENLKRVRISGLRKLNTVFAGEYRSAFKGTGLVFESVREYQYGDDARNIDWNVSARANHPYIKEYIEERELSVLLMIDISASMNFGGARSKRETALELASLLLNLAQMNNDRISVLLFSDRVERFIHPHKGRRFVMSVLDEIVKHRPLASNTDIGAAVDFARRVLKKRSVVFCVSDFMNDKNDYFSRLRLLARRHNVIPVHVYDPLEYSAKFHAFAEFLDLETGEKILCDVAPTEKNLDVLPFNRSGLVLRTDEPVDHNLMSFFQRRSKMKRSFAAR